MVRWTWFNTHHPSWRVPVHPRRSWHCVRCASETKPMESVWCGRHHQPPAEALCKAHWRTSCPRLQPLAKVWPFPCHVEASPCAACLQEEGWPKLSRKLSPYCTFCAQCRRYLKPWSRTKSCRSVSQTEFYLIASLASFPVAQLYGSCCLFWMTGMQQGKRAPHAQSMPPFWTWQKPSIALTTRF